MLYKVIKRCDDQTILHSDVSKAKFHPIVIIYFVFDTPMFYLQTQWIRRGKLFL